MRKTIKKIICLTVFSINICFSAYSKEIKNQDYRSDTLVTLRIIEDAMNMSTPVTRAEFSKMIIRSSKYRDKTSEFILENVCNDVYSTTPYASYIKAALDEGYLFTYLGGYFKPDDFVTYNDLARASLALLSYTNDDFRGNQVVGRSLKFEKLGLSKNIDKRNNNVLEKIDIVNGIYNTLNEKVKDTNAIYGKQVFDKLIIDSDNEINASEYVEKNISGPYFVKSVLEINAPFELDEKNVFINGIKLNLDALKDDIINYGYAICYYDIDNNYCYSYTERQDVSAPMVVRKGYIYKIYYSSKNMLVPYRVDIDYYKYKIESEESKFDFSASGQFNEDEYIVYICNKMNDVNLKRTDDNGNIVRDIDESEPYNGSIILAFSYDNIK